MNIVLASSSKQRKDMLDMLGIDYKVVTSKVEEKSTSKDPYTYVEELSLNKALSVKDQLNYKALIIACDTVVSFNSHIYEKPKSKEEAYNNLKQFSNNKNTVITGITIFDLYKNKTITFSESTDVYLKDIPDEDIKWYIDNEEKVLKVCGYAPLGKASLFIKKIDGDFYNLIGLPISRTFEEVKNLGYSLDDIKLKNKR